MEKMMRSKGMLQTMIVATILVMFSLMCLFTNARLVKAKAEETAKEVVMHDDCTDINASIIASKSDNMMLNGTNIYIRTGGTAANASHIVWQATADIGSYEMLVEWDGGQAGFEYAMAVNLGKLAFSVSSTLDGGYIDVPYTATHTPKTGAETRDSIKLTNTTEIAEPSMRFLKITIGSGGISWNPLIKDVKAFKAAEQAVVDVESVTIDTQEATFESGSSLALSATIAPTNASFKTASWAAYDDAACTLPSEVATFDKNVLAANFDDAVDKTVYIVASAGGISSAVKEIAITKKPDVESVTIAPPVKSTILGGKSIALTASILPENANNKNLEWNVYAAATGSEVSGAATILNGILTAKFIEEDSITVFVGASVARPIAGGKAESARIQIVIEKVKTLLSDDCSSTNYVFKSLTDTTAINAQDGKGMLKRQYAEKAVNSDFFYVLGEGSSRTGENVVKAKVPSVYYKVYGDMAAFNVDLVVYDTGNALNPINKAYYIGAAAFYVSNGIEDENKKLSWTYVPIDFTAVPDTMIDPTNYSKLTFSNTSDLPVGTRYLRVDIVGQVSLTETNLGTEEEPSYGFPASYTAHTGLITEEQYKDIKLFYNVFSPFLAGTQIFAEKNVVIEKATTSLTIPGNGLQIRKGVPYNIDLFETLSDNPLESVKVTDFSGVTYEILGDGAKYVTAASGVIAINNDYNLDTVFALQIKITKGDVTEQFEFNLVVPVASVVLSADKTVVKVNTYLQLTADILPNSASIKKIKWTILDDKDADLTSDGRFCSKKVGEYRLQANVDGIDSNIITVNVVDNTAVVDNMEVKEVKVGGELKLTARVTPDTAASLPIVWEIVLGGEFASLKGDTLTAVAEGTVKVRATVDGVACEFDITILKADEVSSGWVIASIIIGGVIVLGGGGFCLYYFVFRKKKS